MNTVDVWITIGLLTLATFITRGALFLLGHTVKLPPKIIHALRYAPAAALAAIVAPDLLIQGNTFTPSVFNPRLIGAVAATLFFLGTRHLLGTIIVGMLVFSLARLYL